MTSDIERLTAENKRLKLRLEKAKGFLGSLSFEQRMSITSIRGYAELLLKSGDEIEFSEFDQTQYLSFIANNGEKLRDFQTMAQDIIRAILSSTETFCFPFEVNPFLVMSRLAHFVHTFVIISVIIELF